MKMIFNKTPKYWDNSGFKPKKKLYDLYDLIQDPEDVDPDHWCLKFNHAELKDVIIRVTAVKFGEEENPDGTKSMNFNYDVVSFPEEMKDLLFPRELFLNLTGDIIIELLEDYFNDVRDIKKGTTTQVRHDISDE